MNRAIWKFQVEISDSQAIDMPKGSRLLSCQPQNGRLCLWATVDPEAPKVPRLIIIKGTGHPIDDLPMTFVDTAVCNGGSLVWHVFDAGEMQSAATKRLEQ